jgi:CHAT domain-containing protein
VRALAAFLLAGLMAAAPAGAGAQPVSLQDSFNIGSTGLCSASASEDPAAKNMFDRAYAIVCRDAAVPVGKLYALRIAADAARIAGAGCGPAARTQLEGVGPIEVSVCTPRGEALAYKTYSVRRGATLFVAEGLAGYDSALRLGLRSLVADREVAGEVEVATTGAGDPAAFARLQAGTLDAARARAQAYRRNNAGSFADAAEFFSSLTAGEKQTGTRAEALANQALQQSNLGHFAEADTLFGRGAAELRADPVVARMLRNYRAIHLMNQEQPGAALAELDKPLPAGSDFDAAPEGVPAIDAATSAWLNSEAPVARQLLGISSALLPRERARILDAQASHLRGTILRLGGQPGPAAAALNRALAELQAVRRGRVASTAWMRAQIAGELAAIAEARRDAGEAERLHAGAIALLETDYPGSPALLSAQARLAGFYARSGRPAEARALYRGIVAASAGDGISSLSLRRALAPYFALLAAEANRPDSVAEMFAASQLLLRPGVAQTQAVLARELSGGSDEAAHLFRLSVNLGRDIERLRVETARLVALPQPSPQEAERLAAARADLARLGPDQAAAQAKLAGFPRYRAVSGGGFTLAELQALLRPSEAYYKMVMVGEDGYGLFVTPNAARAFPLGVRTSELEREVDALRATISVEENGQILTYPFDVALSWKLFGQLLGPAASDLPAVRHLIFEPDGAMLRLPPNLLVSERSGVDAYLARASRPNDDGFDFTGVPWLGRGREVSTAVSARSFRDVRQVPPSRGSKAYLGLGQNMPPPAPADGAFRALLGENSACAWPSTQWAKPISAAELYMAAGAIRRESNAAVAVVTGQAFSDTALIGRPDLAQYRILHFATHGLVTAPRPECPARPALMTSFGSGDSDGLLSFAEIYDLSLDADLIILSACDTAGKASLAATREAGVTTGGDFALDGLVRAFVGAGGRSVIASHWPVPDDYDATKRLISGLFTAPRGTATAAALGSAETALMDRAETSHPYYWAGFAIIGDGAAPVLPVR